MLEVADRFYNFAAICLQFVISFSANHFTVYFAISWITIFMFEHYTQLSGWSVFLVEYMKGGKSKLNLSVIRVIQHGYAVHKFILKVLKLY